MGIYQEGPDYGYNHIFRKDLAIAQLGNADAHTRRLSLFDLGEELSEDNRLTHKQQKLLIAKLTTSGLLTYEHDLYEASTTSGKSVEELRQEFDLARWEVERNGKVQALVIEAAAILSDEGVNSYEQVVTTTDLIRKIQSLPKQHEKPYNDNLYSASLNRFDAMEGEIFDMRMSLAVGLVSRKVAFPTEFDGLDDQNRQSFVRFSKQRAFVYNRLAALYFLSKTTAGNIEERVRELQEVAHFGYTGDIRDNRYFDALYGGR
jgi:hypothetical protein